MWRGTSPGGAEAGGVRRTARLRDVFAKQRLAEGKYLAGRFGVSVWAEEIEAYDQAWAKARGLSVRER